MALCGVISIFELLFSASARTSKPLHRMETPVGHFLASYWVCVRRCLISNRNGNYDAAPGMEPIHGGPETCLGL